MKMEGQLQLFMTAEQEEQVRLIAAFKIQSATLK
jgi:hypothetical protein